MIEASIVMKFQPFFCFIITFTFTTFDNPDQYH